MLLCAGICNKTIRRRRATRVVVITQFNDDEDEALQGLPLRAQVIYLRGLRRYMNYRTGAVGGHERRISLKMLGEIAESVNNRQIDQPGKKEVLVSIEQLKKVGLIERVEDKDFLIFFLPKASAGESVFRNQGTTTAQLGHDNGTDSGTREPGNGAVCGENNGTPKNDEKNAPPGTTAHIRYTDNGYTDNSLSSDRECGAKAEKAGFVLPDFVNPAAWAEFEQHRKEIRKSLSDLARTKAANQLKGLDFEQQQAVIDYSIQGKYPGLYPEQISKKSLGDRTSQNQGFSKNNGGNYPARNVINANFADKDYGESDIRLPGFPG